MVVSLILAVYLLDLIKAYTYAPKEKIKKIGRINRNVQTGDEMGC
jgi:hypothetical protein